MDSQAILIGIVVGLIVGAGVGYLMAPSTDVSEYENQMSQLLSQISENDDLIDQLEGQIEALESSLQDISQELDDANERYSALLNTLNMSIVMNFTQSIEYNITAGTERTWEFLIPNYGIIWEAHISFSGDYVSMSHAWRRGAERYFVGSSGISLTYKGSEDIVYYGLQDYLWGTISVDYYLDERDPNKLWVMADLTTNLPTIGRGGSAYIDIQ